VNFYIIQYILSGRCRNKGESW